MPIRSLNEVLNDGDTNVFISPIAELFGKLFQSRDVAHIIHLSTKSFEVHTATNAYYDNVVGLLDSLIESYQGMYGLISIKIPSSNLVDALSYFQDTLGYVQGARKLFKDGNLQSGLDDIIDLLASTIYKLRFLQ